MVNVDRIRSILTEKGISVSDISEKIGINRSTFLKKLWVNLDYLFRSSYMSV